MKGHNSVFVASMDEGGGVGNTRQNIMWRFNNGGANWTRIATGARFNPVGDHAKASIYAGS